MIKDSSPTLEENLSSPRIDNIEQETLPIILKADSRGHARRSAFVERSGAQNFNMEFRLR